MTLRATQQINSSFGTYHEGDVVSAEDIGPVLDAWLAAGIIVEEPGPVEDPTMDEAIKVSARKAAKAAPVEKATTPKRETTAGRRVQTEPAPQRRFVQDANAEGEQ